MSLLFRFLFHFLAYLPLSWLHGLGTLLGRLAYAVSANYRRHLEQNLALAYPPADVARLRPAVVDAAGQGVLELPKVWLRPLDEVAGRVVQVSGWDLVEGAWEKGEGIIFLTPHLGCFEITAQYYAAHCRPESPITVLYRPPKLDWLGKIIEAGRARSERLLLAPADLSGVRGLIRALKRKQAVGLLPDQAPGAGEGRWLPFFGKPAYTMTLAARLSEAGGTVLFAYAERLPGGRGYHLRLQAPATPLAGDTVARAEQINRELEALIQQCPGQYLWGYNRYKRPSGAEPPPAGDGAC
ncbi:MAG TPA: lysophospholipid acyltransferase family protein [Azospira sp.]|nr:lysophospholipid acyltransferase family protein [Azospira sp.]